MPLKGFDRNSYDDATHLLLFLDLFWGEGRAFGEITKTPLGFNRRAFEEFSKHIPGDAYYFFANRSIFMELYNGIDE